MKTDQHNEKATAKPVVIRIAPENWHVTASAPVQICVVPVAIFPEILPFTPRLPRMDVWRVHEGWSSFSPLPFGDFSKEGSLC